MGVPTVNCVGQVLVLFLNIALIKNDLCTLKWSSSLKYRDFVNSFFNFCGMLPNVQYHTLNMKHNLIPLVTV